MEKTMRRVEEELYIAMKEWETISKEKGLPEPEWPTKEPGTQWQWHHVNKVWSNVWNNSVQFEIRSKKKGTPVKFVPDMISLLNKYYDREIFRISNYVAHIYLWKNEYLDTFDFDTNVKITTHHCFRWSRNSDWYVVCLYENNNYYQQLPSNWRSQLPLKYGHFVWGKPPYNRHP